MWRGFQISLAILNIAILIMGCIFVFHRSFSVYPEEQVIDYKDFVSILLTAVAVMIAILTIFIAVAAVWGFSAIKDEATKAAEKIATTTAERVAKSTSESVAIRTARGTEPTETSPEEAEEIAEAMGDGQNGD